MWNDPLSGCTPEQKKKIKNGSQSGAGSLGSLQRTGSFTNDPSPVCVSLCVSASGVCVRRTVGSGSTLPAGMRRRWAGGAVRGLRPTRRTPPPGTALGDTAAVRSPRRCVRELTQVHSLSLSPSLSPPAYTILTRTSSARN